ncbi:MAG: hypothetical protein JO102_04195 [Elusimicrobia bacterium]|nr:hypothetical protein [Elusimicrobiota bacterium]
MSAIWLSWENHRRSRELSRLLDVPFEVIRKAPVKRLNPWWPAFVSLCTLLLTDADTVIVQNPSLLLTSIACWLKPFKKYRLIQDLHSYFAQHIDVARGARAKVYRFLSRYCIARADLTIVTNRALKDLIDSLGGRGFVLQDAIPAFPDGRARPREVERAAVVYICTYSDDEPIREVFDAAARLEDVADVYVTGRIPRTLKTWRLPSNVHLTDFLPEEDYLALLRSADAIIGLTTREYTLLCGAYEGLAMRKPLILSNTESLKEYFGEMMVYVENEGPSIADGVRRLLASKPYFDRHLPDFVSELEKSWNERFKHLKDFVRPPVAGGKAVAPAGAKHP